MSDTFSLDPGSTPILTQLPSSQTAFTRKYTNPSLQAALGRLPTNLRKSLIDFDLQRVSKGQQPLGSQQTLLALQSALSNQAATPPPDRSFFSRVADDVRSLVNVPQIAAGLLNEVTELPSAPQKLSEVLGRGDMQSVIGGLAEVPGLRFVPGINTASTLANEGPGGLLEHPVLTALDVLPLAKPSIARATESTFSKLPRVQKVRANLDISAVNAVRDEAGLLPLKEPSATRLAARTSPTLQHFGSGQLANRIRSSFGTMSRDVVQTASSIESDIRTNISPDASPTHPALTDQTAPVREAVLNASDWSKHIPEPRMIELSDRMQLDRNTVLSDPALTDYERAFVNGHINAVDALADFKIQRGWLPERVDGEVLDHQQSGRVSTIRKIVTRVETLNSARNMVTKAESGVAPIIDLPTVKSEVLNATLREQLLRGYAHAYDAAGFDARPLMEVLNGQRGPEWREVGHGPALRELQSLIDNPTPRPQLSQSDLASILKPLSRSDPSYARVLQDVNRGNYSGALDTFRNTIGSRKRHVNPQSAEILDSLIRARDRQKFLDRTSNFSDKALESSRLKAAKIEARIIPARWIPTVEKLRSERLYEMFSTDADAQNLIRDGFPQLVTALRDNPKLLRDIETDVAATIKQLRDDGVDPVFIHRVSASQIPSINYPRITDVLRTPTSVRARTMDATPYTHNATVGLSHEGVEILTRLGSEQYIQRIQQMYGVDEVAALTPYVERGRAAALRDPSLTPAQHAEQLMRRDLTEYDPAKIFPHTQAKLYSRPKDTLFIPKVVEKTLSDMFHDQGFKFTSALDPVMNLFRMSVLPFSPRYHINNIGGGAILTTVQDPAILFNIGKAWSFIKSGEYATVRGLPPSGLGSVPREVIEWGHKSTFSDKVMAAYQFKGAQTLARWMNESKKVTGKVTQAADYLYEFNGKVDDLFRAAGYITGRDKALTRGLSKREAEQAGVALVRKVLPEWDRSTPFERNIVRSVFPFYTFARFTLQYAYRYPIDHPFRIAVTSSIARNELEDFGDSLPSRFMAMFFLGHPDADGNVTALNLGGINPFTDVANYFSLAGFTGKLNPVIATTLEAMGIDPSKGTQDLYPEISYDPVTGRLRPSNPSLLSSFISNVVPQSQIITALIGRNDQFKDILRTNPEAAAAMLRSSAGLPNLFRTVNPSQEAFKAELQREQLQSEVKNEALRTGDWSRAQSFPQLRAYFQQISTLMGKSPELFKGYVPTGDVADTTDALRESLIGLNTP